MYEFSCRLTDLGQIDRISFTPVANIKKASTQPFEFFIKQYGRRRKHR